MNKIKGDLIKLAIEGEFDVIVQGCNCFNVMGSGLAPQIARNFPDAEVADNETIRGDQGKLGTYTMGTHGDLKILNAYTQYGTSKNGEDVFEYLAFERVLSKIAQRFGTKRIGLPYIGMGLAGGDATRIMPAIEAFAAAVERKGGTVTLVEWAR